jgi:hypothetical protein
MIDSETNQVHLPHELASESVRDLLFSQFGERCKGSIARAGDYSAYLADSFIHGSNRGRVFNIDLYLTVP